MPTETGEQVSPSSEQVARKLRYLMQNQSVTVRQLAERIGVTREHLQFVIDGVSKPTRHLLEKICAAFNVKLDFFGKDMQKLVGEASPTSTKQSGSSRSAPLPFTPDSQKKKAVPIGVIPATEEGGSAKAVPARKRKFDLAELAAHHQALLECLLEKKVISPDQYQKKVAQVRERVGLE